MIKISFAQYAGLVTVWPEHGPWAFHLFPRQTSRYWGYQELGICDLGYLRCFGCHALFLITWVSDKNFA